MKKTILLFATAVFAFGNFAKSQNMMIDSSMCNDTVNAGMMASMSSPVTCTAAQTTTFVCTIDTNMCPSGWTTHFCGGMGPMTCDSTQMSPSMTMMNISMGPMQTYNLGMRFYTNSTPGTGIIKVKIYEQGNPTVYTTVNYKLTTLATTGIQEISEPTFKIFPTVATEFITIESNNVSSNVIIYDAIGNKRMEQKLQNGILKASVNELPAGIYFVKIQNGNEQLTKKFLKVN